MPRGQNQVCASSGSGCCSPRNGCARCPLPWKGCLLFACTCSSLPLFLQTGEHGSFYPMSHKKAREWERIPCHQQRLASVPFRAERASRGLGYRYLREQPWGFWSLPARTGLSALVWGGSVPWLKCGRPGELLGSDASPGPWHRLLSSVP